MEGTARALKGQLLDLTKGLDEKECQEWAHMNGRASADLKGSELTEK